MQREKKLEKLRRNPRGWSTKSLISLYTSFGFTVAEGGKHIRVKHDLLDRTLHLPRGEAELLAVYAVQALRAIEEVVQKEEQAHDNG